MVGVEDMVLAMGWRKMRARGYAKNEARGRWREDGGAGACVVPRMQGFCKMGSKCHSKREQKWDSKRVVDGTRAESVCPLGIARGQERANVTQIARAKADADCE